MKYGDTGHVSKRDAVIGILLLLNCMVVLLGTLYILTNLGGL